jgi:hypothetical protein
MLIRRVCQAVAVTGLLMVLTGCAVNRATANLTPGADISKVKSIYVEKEEGDDRNIDAIIKTNLEKRGYTVTTGESKKPPAPVDAKLTYVDKWMWDITMYMLELTITLRDPKNDFPLAVGNSLHTSLSRKSPDEMVDEVLGNIINAQKTDLKTASQETKK